MDTPGREGGVRRRAGGGGWRKRRREGYSCQNGSSNPTTATPAMAMARAEVNQARTRSFLSRYTNFIKLSSTRMRDLKISPAVTNSGMKDHSGLKLRNTLPTNRATTYRTE